MKKILICIFLLLCLATGFTQKIIRGRVIDSDSKSPIEFAVVSLGENGKGTLTDRLGNFEMTVPKDSSSISISIVGYHPEIVDVKNNAGRYTIALKKGPVDLKEVVITPDNNNSSFHTISTIDHNLRPVNSAQDLMRMVPGLFLGQHHGGGIAEHIFLRGFDADHGTDVNVSVDDLPLNLVSHAHGQGFSDLHFLIPELVTTYEFGKGPYYANHGDFATAGYVAFHTYDFLNRSTVKLEAGQFNTGRVMTMIDLLSEKAKQRGESAYIAGEAAYTDGPFDWPQHFSRLNLFGKFNTNLSSKSRLLLTLSTFSSQWRSSGEIPERAVTEGITGRFGYIDSLQGGYTSRTNAIIRITSSLSEKLLLEHQAYYSHYFFNHHFDDTYFLEDSVNGDGRRQRESRDLFGYNGRLTQHDYFKKGMELTSAAGLGWQLNKIYNSELSHTVNYNTILEYLQLGNIDEMTLNAYVDENLRMGNWLFNAGARIDWLYFNYEDKLNPKQPAKNKSIISPKLNIEYTINPAFQVYLKTGKGFHSNDAKVVAAGEGDGVLPAAYGADLGINWKPFPHLFVNAAVWYLYLEQEFVYNADDGTTEPGDKTRRQGVDLSVRYQLTKWLFANMDLDLAKARDIEAAKGEDYLPLSVPFSSTGGLDFKFENGINGGLSYRWMSDRPANSDNSLVAKGYFVTDLTANYTQPKYEIGLEIQNLLNTKWREEQFEVESRFRHEAQPVDQVSFTSGTPFFAKLKFAIFF